MYEKSITDKLVGRSFVSKSNNVCTVGRIGDDAIRPFWKSKPSQADMDECIEWIQSVLGDNVEPTVHVGREGEAEAYEKWKKEHGK
jgi:hypothetical protein